MVNLFPTFTVTGPNPMFPTRSTDPIDLREWLHNILFGYPGESAKGHWVVLRRMDVTQRSQYWNPETHEAIGGPKYPYTDEVVRTRRRLNDSVRAQDDMEQYTDPGVLHVTAGVYFFEHQVRPKAEDEIYEFDYTASSKSTKPTCSQIQLPFLNRFIIREAIPYRCDNNGRIEFWGCYVRSDVVE